MRRVKRCVYSDGITILLNRLNWVLIVPKQMSRYGGGVHVCRRSKINTLLRTLKNVFGFLIKSSCAWKFATTLQRCRNSVLCSGRFRTRRPFYRRTDHVIICLLMVAERSNSNITGLGGFAETRSRVHERKCIIIYDAVSRSTRHQDDRESRGVDARGTVRYQSGVIKSRWSQLWDLTRARKPLNMHELKSGGKRGKSSKFPLYRIGCVQNCALQLHS